MKNWFKVFLFLLVSGSLVYFNSLNNKFLIDDYIYLNNPVMSSTKYILSQWNPYREQTLGVLDASQGINYYRPMQNMVLGFCYAVFKDHYWQYHLLNITLFVFASSLIYLLIIKLTGNSTLALLTGSFYLIHPINGIVVNYISASVFDLQVIFMLGIILLLWESLERKNNQALYFLSLLLSFLSLFWHESALMVPFYVAVVILLFRRDPFKKKLFLLIPYFLILFPYLMIRYFSPSADTIFLKHTIFYQMTIQEYLAGLSQVIGWYMSKLVFPQGIVMKWVMPIAHTHIVLDNLGLCLLFSTFIFLFFSFAKKEILQLAIIWPLIGFAPVFGAAFIGSHDSVMIEPHWFVFSSIGFFILAANLCLIVFERTKNGGAVLLFILIFSWGAISHADNLLWADQKTYALYCSREDPDFRSNYIYLADAYFNEGAFKQARIYYRLSLAGNFTDLGNYNNLGLMDYQEGHWKEAELNYRRALKIYPYSATTLTNLGALYLKQAQWEKAKENFDRALMINPLLTEPRRGLASIFLKHAEYQKAIDLCLKNLDINNGDLSTLSLLVNIYIAQKDLNNIKKYAYKIINIETDPQSLTKFGIHMAQANLPVIALECFEKAIQVDPNYIDAYLAAGTLFTNLGKYKEAIHIWETASSIDPSDQRFKEDIAKVKALRTK